VSKGFDVKKDISGKLLFIGGILLISASFLNFFRDPLINYYYRAKRNFSNNTIATIDANILLETQVQSQLKTLSVVDEQIPSNDSSQNATDQTAFDNGEGFLPLNVDVSQIKTPTPRETQEVNVIPVRLSIPVIDLNADIIDAQKKEVVQGDKTYIQWLAPDEYAVGWHFDSAYLGVPGNTVLNGHHNVYGKVFENLHKLVSGDQIFIYGDDLKIYEYTVTNTMILPERDVPLEQRLENARWILPSDDERVTLITCWPYFSNTHRLIIVAKPIGSQPIPVTNERN